MWFMMKLFSSSETQRISHSINTKPGSYVISFRNKHGPTRLKELWLDFLGDLGLQTDCVSWWSSSGTVGLLECEPRKGVILYGQWVLADDNELIAVLEVDEEDLGNIREGFDAGNVTSYAMRAIRIGETGDKD